MFEQILLPKTKSLLLKLKPDNLPDNSYLGGGTAIALQISHRRSADLDFFTPSEFVEIQWEEKLKKELGFKLLKRDWQTLIATVGEVKISIFSYPYKAISPNEK